MEEKQLSRKEKEEIRKEKGKISKEKENKLRKKTKIIYTILIIIALIAIVTAITDYIRFKQNKKPIFAINTGTYKDGGTKEYLGLGYKVIDFNSISGNNDMKFSSWFTWFSRPDDLDEDILEYNKRKELDVDKLMILENLDIITAKEKELPSNPNKFIELQKDLYNQIKEKENSYKQCLELLIHSESVTKFGKYVLAKIIDDKNNKIKFKFKDSTEFINKYEEYLKKLDIKELEENDLDKIAYDIIFGNPEIR